MAFYDFVCSECDNKFEVYVQGFIEDKDKKCPTCGSTAVRQKFSSFLRNLGSCSSSSSGSGFG